MSQPLEPPYDHIFIIAESDVEKTLRLSAVSKEPETIAWIESMHPWETFFDIGANVGCYSLIAVSRGLRTHAFEPMPANVARLRQNIALNQFPVEVIPYAVGSETGLCSFDWSSEEPGSASHSQGAGSDIQMVSVDDWCWPSKRPQPDHIKIDVDGGELGVVQGAEKTLKTVKSVQVEIDYGQKDYSEILEIMQDAGLVQQTLYPRSIPNVYNVLFRRL